MAVRIERIKGNTGFFREGDELISIGGRPVADQLDVLFLTSGIESARFQIRRAGKENARVLSIRSFERAGLVFEQLQFIRCKSRCLFCFMDQMPPGMRPSLYEKDDDYRLSFLYGNFITLNDVSDENLDRIVQLGLSPLFVSVHAVDRGLRNRIFGRPMRRNIMADLRRLTRSGIVIHAQIVVVPGLNDGTALDRTVAALRRLYPSCRSLAIVPVGITAHRAGLPHIRRVAAKEARLLISWAHEKQARYRAEKGGEGFIHLGDELYLAAGRALPPAAQYDGYPQLANGVGMCRLFLDDLQRDVIRLRTRGEHLPRMALVTGTLGALFLRRYAAPLLARELPEFRMQLVRVPNRLFGSAVGVSGLMAGRDIAREAKRRSLSARCLVVPPNALDHRGRFIDDMTPEELGRTLGLPVHSARRTFLESRIIRLCGGGSAQ